MEYLVKISVFLPFGLCACRIRQRRFLWKEALRPFCWYVDGALFFSILFFCCCISISLYSLLFVYYVFINTFFDIYWRKIPNELFYYATALFCIVRFFGETVTGNVFSWASLLLPVLLWLLSYFTNGGIGMGDVKLAFVSALSLSRIPLYFSWSLAFSYWEHGWVFTRYIRFLVPKRMLPVSPWLRFFCAERLWHCR